MRRPWGLVVVGVLACGDREPAPGSAGDLVARERAFAALSVDSGIRPAFLAFLADSAVLFRPDPVPGRAWIAGRPNPPGTLAWRPTRVMVAGGRDLGWTTGPYTYAVDGDTSRGHFVSVWRRRDGGPWEVLLDLGVSHAAAALPDAVAVDELPERRDEAAPAALRIDLLRRDRLVLLAARDNMREAFVDAYADDALLYREGRAPAPAGPERVRALPNGASTLAWEPANARASLAGDLGVTWGSLTSDGDDTWMLAPGVFRYVRIWRRVDDAWQIILEIAVAAG